MLTPPIRMEWFPIILYILLFLLMNFLPLEAQESVENPFEQGCLLHQRHDVDFMEIRIFSQDWESVFFESWLLQIILSELLDVPTTIETGLPDAKLGFYDPTSPFDYGTTEEHVNALILGSKLGDCRLASREKETYEPCAHMVPEVWANANSQTVKNATRDGYLEVPNALGVVGVETWFMTKFTSIEDPTLDSYVGLQGEDNRRKLAETFLRPTTWKDYCALVSTNNCTTDDGVAQRAPESEEKNDRMFVEGLYTGHFRATEKNDCDLNPTTCTGHIADYPCGWNSFVEQQTYHLNIALESDGDIPGADGYTYSQLLEMWDAANATKSNLMSMWWDPNPQYEKYLGSDAEFHRVALPPVTQECIDARVGLDERCSDDWEVRVGDPAGVCDTPAIPLMKLISGSLFETVSDPSIPLAIRNPSHNVLEKFTMSGVQLNEIFDYWEQEESPREALCKWASENMDYLKSFVPPTYPRVVKDDNSQVLVIIATILGCIATLLVLVIGWMVHRKRKKRAIRYAQLGILRLLLAGSFMIAVGAILAGSPPSDGTCVATIWLINIGYTLELVPLIVKVAAINKMMTAARRMRRITISRPRLFATVAFISFFAVIFLILWSAMDTPTEEAEYELTQSMTDDGSTVVTRSYYCSSESVVWQYVAVGWNALLLLCATVLAMQTRKLRQDFNESRTLAFLIYSHFVFVILRLITIVLSGSFKESILRSIRSLIYSIDTIAAILIYFVPKLMGSSDDERATRTDYPSSLEYTEQGTRPTTRTDYLSSQEFATATRRHTADSSSIRQPSEPPEPDPEESENGDGALNIYHCSRCGFEEGKPLLTDEGESHSIKAHGNGECKGENQSTKAHENGEGGENLSTKAQENYEGPGALDSI